MSRTAHALAWRSLRRSIIASLSAGIAMNVLITWICAVVIALPPSMTVAGGDEAGRHGAWIVRVRSTTGATGVLSQRGEHAFGHRTAQSPNSLNPDWTGYDVPDPEYVVGVTVCESRFADARGWPCLAMYTETLRARTPESRVRGALHVAGYALPVQPIWPGFAVNSLVYAVGAFAIASPWCVRRAHRFRSRRCVRCGYAIGSSALCTECGHRLGVQACPRPGAAKEPPPEGGGSRFDR